MRKIFSSFLISEIFMFIALLFIIGNSVTKTNFPLYIGLALLIISTIALLICRKNTVQECHRQSSKVVQENEQN